MKRALSVITLSLFTVAACLSIANTGKARAVEIAKEKCLFVPIYTAAEWFVAWPFELSIAARSKAEC